MTENITLINALKGQFEERFGTKPVLFKAPGRINIIGEHTDYNDGFVLPAAIDKAIYFAAARNDIRKLRLFSMDFKEYIEIPVDKLEKSDIHWANYLIGVAFQFSKKGLPPEGVDCCFGGDIPQGAGLSSSAALECGFATCLNDLFEFNIGRSDLILMAQKAEHDFAGVRCGIMDQFASTFGNSEHVIKLDCRSLEYEYYPFTTEEIDIVLCDTRVKHSLASSEYNTRRNECEKGVSVLKKRFPNVETLRDATPEMLEIVKSDMDAKIYLRCHFVIHEIARVEEACKALTESNFVRLGKLMYETHEGLSKEYSVSCNELDLLVNIARQFPEVLGARMMGGGFGGCTINLVKKAGTRNFIESVKQQYENIVGHEALIYKVKISDGAGEITI